MPSLFRCDFRKKYSTQHALIAIIEKARKILDKGRIIGALLTEAFDCMTHYLFIAKHHALNFDMNALNLIFDHLTGSRQRVKINSSFSSYLNIFQGAPQESILRRLLLRVTQMITLRMYVLKMLTSLKTRRSRKSTF